MRGNICWLRLLILPDVRPKNFTWLRNVVWLFLCNSPVSYSGIFLIDWGGAFTSLLSQRLRQG